jgi:hypothetical protein
MNREQKLIDICFDLVLTHHNYPKSFSGKPQDEVAKWVSEQLKECGFYTEPIGASWGVLVPMDNKIACSGTNIFVPNRLD